MFIKEKIFDDFLNIFEHLEIQIDIRIESILIEIDETSDKLIDSINTFIKSKNSNKKKKKTTKSVKPNFKSSVLGRKKILKIDSTKIGHISYSINKNDFWGFEELVENLCKCFRE
jgi:hypothetical protein